jgi:hypothetical protein
MALSNLPRDIIISIASVLAGAAISWLITNYYVSKNYEDARQAKLMEAYNDGFERAQAEFDKTAPEKLEARFPTVFEAMRKETFESGRLFGLNEARDEAANHVGRLTDNQCSLITLAQRDWLLFSKRVATLGAFARNLQDAPANKRIEENFVAEATALLNNAYQLRQQYERKAKSFNSIVDELAEALKSRNFVRMRELSIALSLSMESKENQFLSSAKEIEFIFQSMRTD